MEEKRSAIAFLRMEAEDRCFEKSDGLFLLSSLFYNSVEVSPKEDNVTLRGQLRGG